MYVVVLAWLRLTGIFNVIALDAKSRHLQIGVAKVTTNSVHSIVSGQSVTIRPICSSDGVMEDEFVRNLSVETKHYRFLGGVKELSPDELKRLCDVDGLHTMAFVATIQEGGHEEEIGVSRYAESSDEDVREMAVTVADEWQQKGLGRLLATRLIEYAKSHGVKQLYSVDLADNSAMRKLASELRMSVRRDPDDPNQVIYSLVLR
jgi:GNAT superfamily N-acetyltransferase